MTEVLAHLAQGFLTVFQPINLVVLAVGLVLGLLVAVLPGLTLVMGVVLALPFTYKMGITPAVILLTAMYVTGTYGGAFTSILFRIPGEPIDVPLLWDGYAMAKNGEPAKALGWTLFAALTGGLVAAIVMVAASEPVAKLALTFSTPEYFSLVLFGLASVVCLGGGSQLNAFVSLFIGLLIASVGVDGTYGIERFSFGFDTLRDGIEYLGVMVGAYGLGEVLLRLEKGFTSPTLEKIGKIETRLPSVSEIYRIKGTFARSSILGIVVGIVPGAGATIASFLSYGIEAQYGSRRKEMGSGVPEGIVAPQAAATASIGGAMIPLLTMGIPGSGATAIMLAAFMLKGVQPGPQVFLSQPDLIYAIFAAVFASLIGMALVGYFAIKALVKVLDLNEAAVSTFVVMFCFIGALAARNNVNDLWTIVAFGAVGYLFEKFRFPIAPMVLGCILGPLAESYFLTSMISAENDWTVFFTRPVSLVLVLLSIVTFVFPIYRSWRDGRRARAA
jgi:putative tricarboxylic transport membrane protein